MATTKKSDTIEARLASATADYASAGEAATAAADAHTAARGAYAKAPTPEAGAAVLRARDEAELASARLAHAEELRATAQAEVDVAREAAEVVRLEAERAAADRAKAERLASLRETASLDRHRDRARLLAETFIEAERMMRSALNGTVSSYQEANEAAAALREEGEEIADLDSLHVLGHLLAARGGYLVDLHPVRHASEAPLEKLLAGLELFSTRGKGGEGAQVVLRDELQLRLRARSLADADTAVREAQEARAPRPAPVVSRTERAPIVPPPAPSLLERAKGALGFSEPS